MKKLVQKERENGLLSNVDAADLILLKVNSFETLEVNFVAHLCMLWKVDLDLATCDLSKLRLTQDDEGVHRLREWKFVLDYWFEQPKNGRLHMLVKAPATCEWISVPSDYQH